MHAKQLSQRGGDIYCEQVTNERVIIGGNCVFYMKGRLQSMPGNRQLQEAALFFCAIVFLKNSYFKVLTSSPSGVVW